MNREPSIHISEARLTKILDDLFGEIKLHELPSPKNLANEILLRAKKHSLSHRNLLVSNDRHAKLTEKVVKSSMDDASTMAKVIYQVRKSLRHRGIEIALPGHRDWPIIKNITKNAVEFANEFHGQINDKEKLRAYFIAYITLIAKGLKTFSLIKVQSMHEKTMLDYQAIMDLNNDNSSDLTERAYREFNRLVIEQTGVLLTQYDKEPKEYKNFMLVGQECKNLKVKPEDYIKAQFEGLAWANAIPTPGQLVGPKAKERLQKYLFENKIQLGNKSEEKNIDRINKLKNLREK